MTENNSEQPAPEQTPEPGFYPPPKVEDAPSKPPVALLLGLGGLVVVALLVVFVLPSIVSEYELPLEPRVDVAELAASSVPDPETTISPFEEAQRARLRKEAQDVLAVLLESQQSLIDLEVETWAADDFAAALEAATIGDEYYRNQDFELASENYSRGRDELQALLDRVPTVLTQTLIEAQAAFNRSDAGAARELFSLALVLDPANAEAQSGLDRANVLEQVNELIAAATSQIEESAFEQASATLDEAATLDSLNEQIPQLKAQVSRLILERDFNRLMSAGYSQLEQGNPEAAIAEFQRAAAMGVNPEQAMAAIEQTETEVANAEITAARAALVRAQAAEDWHAAVAEYEKVLAIDPNLTFALEGLDYSGKRAQLDDLLIASIANPQRFSEQAVFDETLDIYYTGRAIENPGPKLTGQLDELQALLENSQVPIEVRLVSDSLTDVSVLRVEELGLFEQRTLSLKPGNYVAVGRRAGYREVREEFTVGFGQTPEQVVVQCVELVAASGRR